MFCSLKCSKRAGAIARWTARKQRKSNKAGGLGRCTETDATRLAGGSRTGAGEADMFGGDGAAQCVIRNNTDRVADDADVKEGLTGERVQVVMWDVNKQCERTLCGVLLQYDVAMDRHEYVVELSRAICRVMRTG